MFVPTSNFKLIYHFNLFSAYTAPTFTHVNNTLIAQANRWSPKPNVTWFTIDQDVLQGSTYFSEASNNIYSVVSTLQTNNNSGNYLCKIENDLVLSTSIITSAGGELNHFHWGSNDTTIYTVIVAVIPGITLDYPTFGYFTIELWYTYVNNVCISYWKITGKAKSIKSCLHNGNFSPLIELYSK